LGTCNTVCTSVISASIYIGNYTYHISLCNKPTRCFNFTNLFWHETLHVSDSSSVHHQQFIHCTLSNSICHTGLYTAGPGWNCSSIPVLLEGCLQTCMTHTIVECTMNKLLMMDRRTVRNMQSFMPK